MDSSYLIILLLTIILTGALAASLVLVFQYRNSYLALKTESGTIASSYISIGDFMRYFADKISLDLNNPGVYNEVARKISQLINAEDACIYILKDSKYFIPIGNTDNYSIIFNASNFVLSKPRFVTDAIRQDKIAAESGIFGEIVSTMKGIFIPYASSDNRLSVSSFSKNISSFMAQPVIKDGSVIAIICAVNQTNHAFSIQQFKIFESLSRVFGVVNQIIHSYALASNKDQLDKEIEFTRLLQQSLMPKEFPPWKPFEIYAYTRSAKEVNGDFYDFVKIDENRMLVILGDASGKGLPACMMMAMTRSFLRANAARFTTLNEMMLELNSNLYRDTSEGRYVTLTCCLLDKKENSVELARAGHTEVIVFSSRQKVRRIKPVGPALGVLPQDMVKGFDSLAFTFKPYYSMLLYSDGINEAINLKEEEFGTDSIVNIFYDSCRIRNSPSKTAEKILRKLDEFCGNTERGDDQTILIVAHEESFI